MNRHLVIPGLAAAMIAASVLLGGTAPLGRVALALGMNDTAASFFTDPGWRGVALYRANRFDEAIDAFTSAGPDFAYQLGNAEVKAKQYAAALESYDLALAHRYDPDAEANFALIRAFYAGTQLDPDSLERWGEDRDGTTEEAHIARGSARAAGTGDDVTNTGATIGLVEVESRKQASVRKVFDDRFVVAGPRWLATLEDVPGKFLRARISEEHKRRKKAGIAQPEAETAW